MAIRHTYALLAISKAAYDEIKEKLSEVSYDHCFMENGDIDMHGLALMVEQPRDDSTDGSASAESDGGVPDRALPDADVHSGS